MTVRISEFDFPVTSGIRTRTASRCAMGAVFLRDVFAAIAAHNSVLIAGWESVILLRSDLMLASLFLREFSLRFAVVQRALVRVIASFSMVAMSLRADPEISFLCFSRTP